MPHRNRVTPLGEIVAVPERGTLMGNRGVLHDEGGTLRRDWQVRRWIACRLEFRGRHRDILQPRRWTELFFLDEATALAAGHRPCAECRNADFRRWQRAWAAAHPDAAISAGAIDRALHADRLTAERAKRTFTAPLGELPTGTMVLNQDAPCLVLHERLCAWTPAGYTETRRAGARELLTVLTPASAVAAIAAGYELQLHPTAVSRVA
jgi:hypothetical protein